MTELKTYRGHIRNWDSLCDELGVDKSLPPRSVKRLSLPQALKNGAQR